MKTEFFTASSLLLLFSSCNPEPKAGTKISDTAITIEAPANNSSELQNRAYTSKEGGFTFKLSFSPQKLKSEVKGLGYSANEPNFEILNNGITQGVITFLPKKLGTEENIGKMLTERFSKQDDFSVEPPAEKVGANDVYFYNAVKLSSAPTRLAVIKATDKEILVVFYQSVSSQMDSLGKAALNEMLENLVIEKK